MKWTFMPSLLNMHALPVSKKSLHIFWQSASATCPAGIAITIPFSPFPPLIIFNVLFIVFSTDVSIIISLPCGLKNKEREKGDFFPHFLNERHSQNFIRYSEPTLWLVSRCWKFRLPLQRWLILLLLMPRIPFFRLPSINQWFNKLTIKNWLTEAEVKNLFSLIFIFYLKELYSKKTLFPFYT